MLLQIARSRVIAPPMFSLALFISGCAVTKVDQSVQSPAGAEIAAVVAYSAAGENFDQRGTKRLYLSVRKDRSEPPTYLFQKELGVVASEPNWLIQWLSGDEVLFTIRESTSGTIQIPASECDRRAVAKVRAVRQSGENRFRE